MPRAEFKNFGEVGLLADLDLLAGPVNAFSDLVNVRPIAEGLQTIFNYGVNTGFGTVASPFTFKFFEKNEIRYWISASATKLVAHNGTTSEEIATGQSATAAIGWQLENFNGILLANNSFDHPQTWDGTFSAGATDDLVNWPTDYTARVFRKFRNFLYALDVTSDTGFRFHQRVWWAHPAEPGELPETWDVTDDTKDAGWFDVGLSTGRVVDGLELGDRNLIYTTDSVYEMIFIGPPLIFKFNKLRCRFGALGTDCVVSIPRGHVVWTQGDVVLHTGDGNFESIVTDRVRKNIFSRLTPDNSDFAFLAVQPVYNEVWICVPSTNSVSAGIYPCDFAYTWNWVTGAIGTRQLPLLYSAANGFVRGSAAGAIWSGAASTASSPWDLTATDSDAEQLLGVGHGINSILWMDQFDSTITVPESYIERFGLAVIPLVDNTVLDALRAKYIEEIAAMFSVEGQRPEIELAIVGQNTSVDPQTVLMVRAHDFTRNRQSVNVNTVIMGYYIRIKPPANAYSRTKYHALALEIKDGGLAA